MPLAISAQDQRFFSDCVSRYVKPELLPFMLDKGFDRACERISAAELGELWEKAAKRESARRRLPLFQLYIHAPFCDRLCHFCDLNPILLSTSGQLDVYVDNLLKMAEFFSPAFENVAFRSIFMGGGTPSLLSESQLEKLLAGIMENLQIAPEGERCIEVHAKNFTETKLDIICRHGFNKVNLGVQTFDSAILASENRDDQTKGRALDIAKKIRKRSTIGCLNIDLILGLLGDKTSYLESFKAAVESKPDTITLYPLRPTEDYMARFYGGERTRFQQHFGRLKHEALVQLPLLGKKYGYTMEAHHERWYFRRKGGTTADRHGSYADRSTQPVSVLGLGPKSRSHIAQSISYLQEDGLQENWNPAGGAFVAYRSKPLHERFKFLLGELVSSQTLSRLDFESLFGDTVERSFSEALQALIDAGRVEMRSDSLHFLAVQRERRMSDALTLIGPASVRDILDEYNYGNFRFSLRVEKRVSSIWVEKRQEARGYSVFRGRYGLVVSGRAEYPHDGLFIKTIGAMFISLCEKYPHRCADELTDLLYRMLRKAKESASGIIATFDFEVFEPRFVSLSGTAPESNDGVDSAGHDEAYI